MAYDAESDELDEVCYATVDIAGLREDMTRAKVNAVENLTGAVGGTFTVSVQAADALRAARAASR